MAPLLPESTGSWLKRRARQRQQAGNNIPWMSWLVVGATVIDCQALAASGIDRPRLAVMLPQGRRDASMRDASMRDAFLRGFRAGEVTLRPVVNPFLVLPGKGCFRGSLQDLGSIVIGISGWWWRHRPLQQ